MFRLVGSVAASVEERGSGGGRVVGCDSEGDVVTEGVDNVGEGMSVVDCLVSLYWGPVNGSVGDLFDGKRGSGMGFRKRLFLIVVLPVSRRRTLYWR